MNTTINNLLEVITDFPTEVLPFLALADALEDIQEYTKADFVRWAAHDFTKTTIRYRNPDKDWQFWYIFPAIGKGHWRIGKEQHIKELRIQFYSQEWMNITYYMNNVTQDHRWERW